MRDDFDELVADRFKLLDEVRVPDTWSKVRSRVRDDRPASSADFSQQDLSFANLEAAGPTTEGRPRRDWMLAAAAVLVVVGIAVVFAERGSRQSAVVTTATPHTTPGVVSPFSAAIESAGLLISPSAEERALASDTSLYEPDESWTQVSAAGNFVSLGRCHSVSACGTSWAYVTGSVGTDEVHRGLLGEADAPEVFVLDDRFFVAVQESANPEQPATAWLIDSVSGGRAELRWRPDPTTVSSREQALLFSDGPWSALEVARLVNSDTVLSSRTPFLPRVVDGSDGTIRPLAVPDNASANLPVMQTGTDRIWIGTALDGRALGEEEYDAVQMAGYAYSDDGGATWTQITVPAQLLEGEQQATKKSSGLSIAADGDRIAIISAWSYNKERFVYVSDNAGLTWSTVTIANPAGNGAHLYVLADKRLMLLRSHDVYTEEILVSTGADWTVLEHDTPATQAAGVTGTSYITASNFVSVNPDGTVLILDPDEDYSDVELRAGESLVTTYQYRFSTDMRNWRTIPILED